MGTLREVLERGGGVWDPQVCDPKWPDQIFPTVNFVFSHGGPFGLRGGGGYPGVRPIYYVPGGPGPMVVTHSNTSLAHDVCVCVCVCMTGAERV